MGKFPQNNNATAGAVHFSISRNLWSDGKI